MRCADHSANPYLALGALLAAGVLASTVGIIVTFTAPWTILVAAHVWLLWIGVLVVGSLLLGVALFFLGHPKEKGVPEEKAL